MIRSDSETDIRNGLPNRSPTYVRTDGLTEKSDPNRTTYRPKRAHAHSRLESDMTTAESAAAARKRRDDARAAHIAAHANAVPPTDAYLAAKAELLAKVKAGTHLPDGKPNTPPF